MKLVRNKKLKKIISSEKYILDYRKHKSSDLKFKVQNLINQIGFCVIDNLIDRKLNIYVEEIKRAKKRTKFNTELFKKLLDKKFSEKDILNYPNLEVRKSKFSNRKCKLVNDIFWLQKFSNQLGNKNFTNIIKFILDDHVRIGQIHSRYTKAEGIKPSKTIFKNDDFGLPRVISGNKNSRDWHTDWPHDPWAYGGGKKSENIGCIKEPFPDLIMGLVAVHHLSDPGELGGTWVVPGSHKSGISPRHKNFSYIKAFKDEFQVKVKAGSVYLQDTRLWHSAPVLGETFSERAIVVSRWYPWWLQIDDYAPSSRFNIVARPLSKRDFESLPKNLRPYLLYLCNEKNENINDALVKRTKLNLKKSFKFLKNENHKQNK